MVGLFIYGEEEYCAGKESIKVRKRKRSTIVKKLEEAGMSHEVAYAMVEDTHGLYVPLKKKIIRGKYRSRRRSGCFGAIMWA